MNSLSGDFTIILFDGSKADIRIIPERLNTLSTISTAEAREWCEAEIQLIEGCSYEYRLENYLLSDKYGIANSSSLDPCNGRLTPKNYVGTLSLDVLPVKGSKPCGTLKLEVRSVKVGYRNHYRSMLGDIADKCNELLLQSNTPISQTIDPLFTGNARTLYQRFSFLRAVLDSQEFNDAVNKIISSPVTTWVNCEKEMDIRNVKRFNRNLLRQVSASTKRDPLPNSHPLYRQVPTVPSQVTSVYKVQTVDTPENRFIKHALNTFLAVCNDVRDAAQDNERLWNEADAIIAKLEQYISNTLFRETSQPSSIPLNSPILQRKEGYREVFRVWLMHDLASRITWDGGDDVYTSGKKDVAVLYEYWVFFRLLDMIQKIFKVKPEDIAALFSPTPDGLSLNLKQDKHIVVQGIYETSVRNLCLEFSYNRTFSGNNQYPLKGSWTRGFRPDYTLSIWPYGVTADKAEEEETIVHVHFDAKYKVRDLKDLIGEEPKDGEALPINPADRDLLKMHAYRDAIRRTGGAYIIYPGTDVMEKRGFHEIIPGLGAFTLNPGYGTSDGDAIESFLLQVSNHLLDRATQREKMSLKTYQTYRNEQIQSVFANMPLTTGENRGLIPDETYVLVAWYRSYDHLKWIEKKCLYNFRTGDERGSLELSPALAGAKYILLHGSNETTTNRIYTLSGEGPKIWSAEDLIKKDYPSSPSVSFYLVYKLKNSIPVAEYQSLKWDIKELGNYTSFRGSSLPFVASITELMKVRVR